MHQKIRQALKIFVHHKTRQALKSNLKLGRL
jgi:hypothetical protein